MHFHPLSGFLGFIQLLIGLVNVIPSKIMISQDILAATFQSNVLVLFFWCENLTFFIYLMIRILVTVVAIKTLVDVIELKYQYTLNSLALLCFE